MKIELIEHDDNGKSKFFPFCLISREIFKVFKKSSLTVREVNRLKQTGFEIVNIVPPYKTSD